MKAPHVKCPQCDYDRCAIVGDHLFHCPNCKHYFEGEKSDPAPLIMPASIKSSTRKMADALSILSGVALFFSIIAFGFVLQRAITGEGVPQVPVTLGIVLMASSFWIFLIAQIVHIRANTEK